MVALKTTCFANTAVYHTTQDVSHNSQLKHAMFPFKLKENIMNDIGNSSLTLDNNYNGTSWGHCHIFLTFRLPSQFCDVAYEGGSHPPFRFLP